MVLGLDNDLLLKYQADVEVYLQERGIELLRFNSYCCANYCRVSIVVRDNYKLCVRMSKKDVVDILAIEWILSIYMSDRRDYVYVMVGRLSELLIELRKL